SGAASLLCPITFHNQSSNHINSNATSQLRPPILSNSSSLNMANANY
ncbi:unnamed protein product, partial [Rotaria sp. Silwood1]